MRIGPVSAVFAALAVLAQPALSTTLQARTVSSAPAHQRVLPLEGGQNFRDLGGYRTEDGRHVVWGKLYRSGSPQWLTARDYAYLEKLGIRTVCDFRSDEERRKEPYRWPAAHAPRLLSDDYGMADAGLMPSGDIRQETEQQGRELMIAMYPRILEKFNGQYRRMFRELLAGHAPLAFNCSAGKDRTGVAAALLLTALGVPRQTVIADYELTNTYLKTDRIANQPSGGVHAMMVADPAYIGAVFKVLDAHKGGAMGYLHDELGLSAQDIARLRALYTV